MAAAIDREHAKAAVFIVHRGLTETLRIELAFDGIGVTKMLRGEQMSGFDPKAANTFERPDVVLPRTVAPVVVKDGRKSLKLPPMSVTVLEFSIEER